MEKVITNLENLINEKPYLTKHLLWIDYNEAKSRLINGAIFDRVVEFLYSKADDHARGIS